MTMPFAKQGFQTKLEEYYEFIKPNKLLENLDSIYHYQLPEKMFDCPNYNSIILFMSL
jgi:hypothetical protein